MYSPFPRKKIGLRESVFLFSNSILTHYKIPADHKRTARQKSPLIYTVGKISISYGKKSIVYKKFTFKSQNLIQTLPREIYISYNDKSDGNHTESFHHLSLASIICRGKLLFLCRMYCIIIYIPFS